MPIRISEEHGGKVVAIQVSGKLDKADYLVFVPEFEEILSRHRHLHVLFEMKGFQGWDASAVLEDFKFGVNHIKDIERIAMVGDQKWEQIMATFCKPFTKATLRYFDHRESDQARKWLEE